MPQEPRHLSLPSLVWLAQLHTYPPSHWRRVLFNTGLFGADVLVGVTSMQEAIVTQAHREHIAPDELFWTLHRYVPCRQLRCILPDGSEYLIPERRAS